jgi:archaellum biogenesis ATPase FlaH
MNAQSDDDDYDFLCSMKTQAITTDKSRKDKFRFRNVSEFFLPRPPKEYICGIIPVGSLTMIAADGASGKTQFLLWSLLSEQEKYKSMFISAEMSDDDFKARGEQLARGLGITKKTSENFPKLGFDTVSGVVLPNPELLEELVQFLILNEIQVLAIDSFSATFGGTDENNAVEGNKYLNAIRVIRDRTSCKTVIFIHHVTRGTTHSRGTTALPNGCDNVISISVLERASTYIKTALIPAKTRNGAHVKFLCKITWYEDCDNNTLCTVEIDQESDDTIQSDENGQPVGKNSGKLWEVIDSFKNGGTIRDISDKYESQYGRKIQQVQVDRLVQEGYAVKKGKVYVAKTK